MTNPLLRALRASRDRDLEVLRQADVRAWVPGVLRASVVVRSADGGPATVFVVVPERLLVRFGEGQGLTQYLVAGELCRRAEGVITGDHYLREPVFFPDGWLEV